MWLCTIWMQVKPRVIFFVIWNYSKSQVSNLCRCILEVGFDCTKWNESSYIELWFLYSHEKNTASSFNEQPFLLLVIYYVMSLNKKTLQYIFTIALIVTNYLFLALILTDKDQLPLRNLRTGSSIFLRNGLITQSVSIQSSPVEK